ncbi:hypothetical protein [Dactylosporangium sp. NPDC005555]|uniref:hypothetical protein n=1 Tax=Dactylosporangium sp. NPDC005555 TaxID=3154889 RepID=UPI0033B6CBDB
MPYRWWPATLAALVGITDAEVLQALNADRRRPLPGFALGIPALSIWARTDTGRALIVVVKQEGQFSWGILGARDMTPDELAEFEKWEASAA